MRTTIKDFIIALFIAAILILLFSTYGLPDYKDMPQLGGGIPQYPGDSGIVIQGNGTEPAEIIMTEFYKDTKHEAKETEELSESSDTNKKDNEENEEFNPQIIKEEQGSMNEMLLTFWHGVAAVLIGESIALMVAAAWMKICRNNDSKKKNS